MPSESSLVGLDNDLIRLKDRLTGHDNKLQIIPIVGMGGIGKTTLVTSLYDDPLIVHHFDIRRWATVSQTHSIRDILLSLLQKSDDLVPKERLEEDLYKSLKLRRYLIIIDDVWSYGVWDDVTRVLPDDNNGSRIMLTTRLSELAIYASSNSSFYQMPFLDEDKGWDLFRGIVFAEEENYPPEIGECGKRIVAKCQGLPLAIVVIAGLLLKENKDQEYWEYVSSNLSSVLTMSERQCSEILTLSYNHLPAHLKPCFLYMGVFPEDSVIRVSKLIKLWVAEGFIDPFGDDDLEEIAEDYLKDLIDRNLIMVRQESSSKKPKTCTIHDLLRDICVKEARKEKFLYVLHRAYPFDSEEATSQRQISVHASTSDTRSWELYCLMKSSACRSFMSTSSADAYLFFKLGSRLVRVLDVDTQWRHFPEEIFELVNLRYLELSYVDEEIPCSISVLGNLQSLIIPYRYRTYQLSKIWEMPQLRHVKLYRCFLPDPPPAGDKSVVLEHLQTLSTIVNFRCTEEVVKRIPNLKRLKIIYKDISSDADWSYYCIKNLVFLDSVDSLSCFFDTVTNESFIRNLRFPILLTKLTLRGCKIPWDRIVVVGALPYLEELKLQHAAFVGPVWESNEDEFRELKFLLMEKLNIREWKAESSHFPGLKRLVVRFCFDLEEIPYGIGEIPTLEEIEVCECSPATEVSLRDIVEVNGDIKGVIKNDRLMVIALKCLEF